jgi:hypothetical protein
MCRCRGQTCRHPGRGSSREADPPGTPWRDPWPTVADWDSSGSNPWERGDRWWPGVVWWGWLVPREDEPRIQVRFSFKEMDLLRSLAKTANLSLGGLVREAAMRSASEVARDAGRGDVRIRRGRAVEAVRGQVAPASSLVVESDAVRWARERQARLNRASERARGKS